jgi:hypothetical protein
MKYQILQADKLKSLGTLEIVKDSCLQAIQFDDSDASSEDQEYNPRNSIGLFYNGNNPIREMIDRAGMDIAAM